MTDVGVRADTGARRRYVKPFVRNLDVSDTEKAPLEPRETTLVYSFGPS
jgi:hypothetical protein